MTTTTTLPKSFWIIASLIMLWMIVGVLAFVMDLMTTPQQAAASMTAAQNQLRDARPTWLFFVYGTATVAGAIGAVLLLMRKASAIALLAVSLVAIVIQFGYTIFAMGAPELLGTMEATAFPAFIVAMGAFSLWYATQAKARGWIS